MSPYTVADPPVRNAVIGCDMIDLNTLLPLLQAAEMRRVFRFQHIYTRYQMMSICTPVRVRES